MKKLALGFIGTFFCLHLSLQAEEQSQKGDAQGQHWMGLPAIAYSSDTGFGFGVTGITYHNSDGIKPYKYSVRLQVFATTKGRQAHYAILDYLNLGGVPLRLQAYTGVNIETNQAFCGFGMAANCDQGLSDAFVRSNDPTLVGDAFKKRSHEYYQYRYLNAYGYLTLRYAFMKKPALIEGVFRWHGNYYRPGSFTKSTTYPGLYIDQFINPAKAKGLTLDKGFSSVVAVGMMFDSRDIEANPTSGYLIDTTVRASGIWTGSSWTYYGFNIDAMGYIPLTSDKKLVLAGRGIVDLMDGEAPLQEIVRVASSLEQSAYGGSDIGRGIRQQVMPGRIKFIHQLSLRWNFYDFTLWDQEFGLGASIFGDFGYILWDWANFKDPFKIEYGLGAGIFVVWNERFVVRFQLGFSPYDKWSPGIYFRLGNVF